MEKDYYFDTDTQDLKIGWFESGRCKGYADPDDGGALARSKTLIIDGISHTHSILRHSLLTMYLN